MTQVMRVSGQARCNACTSGTTWQVSPMAESRSRQMLCGAGETFMATESVA